MKPIRAPKSWAEFTARVEAAHKKRRKSGGRPEDGEFIAKLRAPISVPLSAPQCQVIRKNGLRCRRRAIRGAQRCLVHGGLLEVPEHPANAKRRERYSGKVASAAARAAFYEMPPEHRQPATEALTSTRRSRGGAWWRLALNGAQAHALDDGGRAFRRWLTQINKPEETS